jgi:hypothetical protein
MSNKMQNTDEWLTKLLSKSPIAEEPPKGLWESLHATWTGIWTDFWGKWDELQASDVFPITDLLSEEAEQRLKQAISERIAADYIPKHHSFVHDSSLFDGNGTPLCYVCSMPNVYHKAGVKVYTEAEVAAEEASLIGDIARAVGILQGLGYPDEYLEKRLAALTPQASEGEKT